MQRTTVEQVSKLVEVDPTIDVQPFIDTASLLVDDNCTTSGYSDAKLELIERWLSAHLYAVRDPSARPTQEGVGRGAVQASYSSAVGFFFKNTMQGQQALLLDTKGNLAALDKKMQTGATTRPGAFWLGTDCGAISRIEEETEE